MTDPPRVNLSLEAYAALTEGAALIEKDGHGPKVLRLADSRMLKLFRIKRILSSNLLSPYARRFARNAAELRRRGIGSVAVEQWGRIPHLTRQYALYPRVEGTPLRDVSLEPRGERALLESFARFFGELHAAGVYFRSCHFGNVLAVPGNGYCLIDVMDASFVTGQLSWRLRVRNFRHLLRYAVDRERIQGLGEGEFLERYESGLTAPDGRDRRDELAERVGRLLSAL